MAQSSWASGLAVERWAKELMYEVGKEIYFEKFMGSGPDSLIQVKNELNGQSGDSVTFGLITNLSGSGISGDSTLEGNEESMGNFSQTVSTSMIRHAVRNTGRFDDSKVLYDFRVESLAVLKTWIAEYIDSQLFTNLVASCTYLFRADAGGDSVASRLSDDTDQLAAADLIVPADISALQKLAKVPGVSGQLRIRPIRVGGREYYVLLVHPEVAYDLKQNSTFTQALREAEVRGSENPLFSGAIGIWDGVVIHEHENISLFDDGGGGAVHGAHNLFLGAQAGVYATVGDPIWVEKSFDYGNQLGVAGGLIFGNAKVKFDSDGDSSDEDFAVIRYSTASTDFSA